LSNILVEECVLHNLSRYHSYVVYNTAGLKVLFNVVCRMDDDRIGARLMMVGW